jgi:ABC-2 type transport system permease protein
MISYRRVKAIARKEIYHIRRDPFTLAMALGLPIFLVIVFGLAIDLDVKNIRIAIDDRDKTYSSRLLIDKVRNTDLFNINIVSPYASPEQLVSSEKAKAVMIIEPGFENHFLSNKEARVQILVDGADNSTIGSLMNYIAGIQEAFNGKKNIIAFKTRFLYNPELDSKKFIIPGLIVIVVAIISILLTALTVAREWENGSMELLLTTPVRPMEIVLGKLAPYTFIGLLAFAFIYAVARIGFGIPFRGSHVLFVFSFLIFLSAYLAQGLLISITTRKQLISMQIGMVSGLLPSILLSGFIFPIQNMPAFFQFLTSFLPARWFIQISRDLFLKGTNMHELVKPIIALLLLNILLVTVAVKKFKRDLE